jgi:hypothetical protein
LKFSDISITYYQLQTVHVPATLLFPATNAVEEVYIHILKIKGVIKN